MKKLMFTAAVAAAMGAFAIESANTVGYVSTGVAANKWQINGCQFQNVGDDEMDLQDLVGSFTSTNVTYGDGNSFKATAPCIQIQDRDANGNLTAGNTFYYYLADAATDAAGNEVQPGWADEFGYYVGEGAHVGAVKIAPGTAVWFKDPSAAAPNASVSGEVVGEASAPAIKANAGKWSLTANPFPVAFDLNSSKITWTGVTTNIVYGDGNTFKNTAPTIQIQDRDSNGNLTAGNTFYYYLSDAATDAAGNNVKPGWADEFGYYVGDDAYVSAATVGAGLGFWFKDYNNTVTITFQK